MRKKTAIMINCNWQEYAGRSRTNVGPFQPLELNYISSVLKKQDFDTKIIDLNLIPNQDIPFADYFIITTSPAYLFWRCAPLTTRIPLKKAEEIKKKHPKIKILNNK